MDLVPKDQQHPPTLLASVAPSTMEGFARVTERVAGAQSQEELARTTGYIIKPKIASLDSRYNCCTT